MKSIHLLHRLLFNALTDLRERGREIRDPAVFQLADLFHNAVLQMERIAAGEDDLSYDDVLDFLRELAKQKGCESWLDKQTEIIEQRSAAQKTVG